MAQSWAQSIPKFFATHSRFIATQTQRKTLGYIRRITVTFLHMLTGESSRPIDRASEGCAINIAEQTQRGL